MNNAQHIFTKTRLGLDNRVWLTMSVLALLSLGLLGYKMADRPHCTPFEVKSSGLSAGSTDQYYTGSEVGFYVGTAGSNAVAWDFGDHSKEGTGAYVKHAFMEPGTYVVSATMNGRCSSEVSVTVKKREAEQVAGPASEEGLIIGSDVPEAGRPVGYASKVKAASYEWIVQDNPGYPAQTGEMATIAFKTPGMYVLLLKLHSPDKTSSKVINVVPATAVAKPAAAFPSMPAALPPPGGKQQQKHPQDGGGTAFPTVAGPTDIDDNNVAGPAGDAKDNDFVSMLKEVTEGKRELQSFNKYLCNGGGTKVLANDDKWDSFAAFFEKIRGKKKSYDITSVKTVRDDANCITVLKVTYKKKGLFNFIKPK